MTEREQSGELYVDGVVTFDANMIAAILERHGASAHVAVHAANEVMAYLKAECMKAAEARRKRLQ